MPAGITSTLSALPPPKMRREHVDAVGTATVSQSVSDHRPLVVVAREAGEAAEAAKVDFLARLAVAEAHDDCRFSAIEVRCVAFRLRRAISAASAISAAKGAQKAHERRAEHSQNS